jgi:uncharacterized protein (UPF0297 family)
MKKILVATDFTTNWMLLDRVLDFIKDSKTPITVILVHTYLPQHSDADSIIELNDKLKKKSRETLEELRHKLSLKLQNPHVHWDISSQIGTPARIIKETIAREKIDLVALSEVTEQAELIKSYLREKNCGLLSETIS